MGRFYKTAKPQFVDDIIYQPPWELMLKAGEYKQKRYDEALAKTDLFDERLQIQHIDDEVENEKVRATKDYYEAEVEDITNQLRASGPSPELNRRMKNLERAIAQDRQDGNIAKFEQSAAMQQKHLESIKAAAKDGDVAAAQKGYQTFLNDWRSQENRSIDGTLSYEEVIATPEELKGDNIVDIAKKVPAYENSTFEINPNGGYFIITNEQREEVSEEDLLETISSYVTSNPNLISYLDQRDRFGMGKYFEGEGADRKMISPYEVNYIGPEGNKFTLEEARKLPKEQQDALKKNIDYADNSIGQALRLGSSFEYSKTTGDTKLQVDQVRQKALDRAHDEKMEEIKQEDRLELEEVKQENRIELKKYEEDPEGWQAEQDRLNGFNSFASIKNKPIPDVFGISKDGQWDQADRNIIDNVFSDITKDMNIKGNKYRAYQTLKEKIIRGEIEDGQQANAFLFNRMYPTSDDYLKELGFSQEKINLVRNGTEFSDGSHAEILAETARYEENLTKGEDWHAMGLVNETNQKIFSEFDSFTEKARKYLKNNYSEAETIREFEMLPPSNAGAITNIINENLRDYTIISTETGQPVEGDERPPRMKANIGVSGASGAGKSHTLFEGEDGKRYVAIPKNPSSPSELAIRNISTQGLPNNSRTKLELQDFNRNAIAEQFNKAGKSGKIKQTITLEDDYYGTDARITKKLNGLNATYEIFDPQFGDTIENLDEEMFYTVLKNMAEEKAKSEQEQEQE